MNRRAAALPSHDGRAEDVPTTPAPSAAPGTATAVLARVLALSEEIARLAESGDVRLTATLDAERRTLLASARTTLRPFSPETLAMLQRIGELNDRSIGCLEHRRRALGRDLDLLAVGRRAVRAYGKQHP
jgi:hypothetical protein